MGDPHFRILTSAEEFGTVRDAWISLYGSSGCTSPAMTGAAVHAFLEHGLAANESAVVVLAESGGRLIGALPTVAHHHRGGLQLSTFHDNHTYGVEFLLDPSWPGLPASLVSFLALELPALQTITLADVPADSGSIDALRRIRGWRMHIDESREASFLPVPASSAAFVSGLSQNFRKNLRKQQTKLNQLTSVEHLFLRGRSAESELMDAFLELEASGWKGRSGTAIVSQPTVQSFFRSLAAGLAAEEKLEWHFLKSADRLIGAQMGVRCAGVLNLLKIAYDEEYAAVGPGNMLFLGMLEQERGAGRAAEVNCLTDMPWHRNWRMSRRMHLKLTLYRKQLLPTMLGYAPAVAADLVRRSPLAHSLVRAVKRVLLRHPR